jgi:hypothetical protein
MIAFSGELGEKGSLGRRSMTSMTLIGGVTGILQHQHGSPKTASNLEKTVLIENILLKSD